MDIYNILSTKEHNPHYLKRYIKFIESCKIQNITFNKDIYIERHHICPKGKSMFPEYKSFKQNSWNFVDLTAKQHIIAHILLWKTFGQKCAMGLYCMLFSFNSDTNPNLPERIIPTKYDIDNLSKLREDCKKQAKGKAVYKDNEGNKYHLNTNDPIIQELGLVGNNTGIEMSEESKERMRRAKDYSRTTWLFKQGEGWKSVVIQSSEYQEMLDDGWHLDLTDEDRTYNKLISNEKVSNQMKGRTDYRYPNGTYYGKLYHDDPIIQELNLSYQATENQLKQNKEALQKGAIANTGKKAYNNGKIEKNYIPGTEPSGWIVGGLKRKEYKDPGTKGSSVYNDGVKNYTIKEGEVPDPTWIKGMICFKVRKEKRKSTPAEIKQREHKLLLRRKIKLYFLDKSITIKLVSNEFELYLSQGWTVIKTDEDKQYIKEQKFKKISAALKGRSIPPTTKGTTVYNDGIKNYHVKSGIEPNPEWNKGPKPKNM